MGRADIRLSHVNLRVRELDSSEQFYRDLLGLTRVANGHTSGSVCLGFAGDPTAKPGVVLVLTPGLPRGIALTGVDHFAIEVPSVFDVYNSYLEAKALGAPATKPRVYDAHWQTFIFDPDGYKIEILTEDSGEPPPLVAEENDHSFTAATKVQSAGRSPKEGRPAGTKEARQADP